MNNENLVHKHGRKTLEKNKYHFFRTNTTFTHYTIKSKGSCLWKSYSYGRADEDDYRQYERLSITLLRQQVRHQHVGELGLTGDGITSILTVIIRSLARVTSSSSPFSSPPFSASSIHLHPNANKKKNEQPRQYYEPPNN